MTSLTHEVDLLQFDRQMIDEENKGNIEIHQKGIPLKCQTVLSTTL